MKNHYQTLRLPPNASPEEIKKAFRKLALQFHPDKNDDTFSHRTFLEIQESYAVLSDPKKKKQYDEERYFSGLSSRKEPAQLSADWIVKLAVELRRHMAYLHSYDMNQVALYEYLLLILSDTHLYHLKAEGSEEKNGRIAEELLIAADKLAMSYYEQIIARLLMIEPVSEHIRHLAAKSLKAKKEQHISERLLPWLIIVTILVLCILMYGYGRKN